MGHGLATCHLPPGAARSSGWLPDAEACIRPSERGSPIGHLFDLTHFNGLWWIVSSQLAIRSTPGQKCSAFGRFKNACLDPLIR
jgi:hypothetical protein